MSRAVNLADLQAAYAAGRDLEVQEALLGKPVRRKPPAPTKAQPETRTRAGVRPRHVVLTNPADWPYRLRPEDVDAFAYEIACEQLWFSDEPLVRAALGWSAPDAPTGSPRFSHVCAVVTKVRREVLRDLGCVTGRVNPPRGQKDHVPVRTYAEPSPVVRWYRGSETRYDETRAPISREQADALLRQVGE